MVTVSRKLLLDDLDSKLLALMLETAVHLLRRLAQVVKTGQPYEPRDLEGHPMPAGRDRRQFIADHLTVPDSVRNRTRSHRPA